MSARVFVSGHIATAAHLRGKLPAIVAAWEETRPCDSEGRQHTIELHPHKDATRCTLCGHEIDGITIAARAST